jgi:anti-anti-sigma factor
LRLSLRTAKPSITTPVPDVFEGGGVEAPVGGKAFQPSAQDVAGADLIAINYGSIRRIVGKNTLHAYFSLFDEFDIYNKGQLSAALEESVGSRTITIDLAHTTFIDASILGVFVRLANRCRRHNAAQVRIVNASTHLNRLFSICRLEGVFDIEGHGARHRGPNRI